MASLELTRLMNNARVHLPGAIDVNLQLELFNVLDSFFQTSNAWTEDITFQVTPGIAAYSIENESVASMVRLNSVLNGSNIPVTAVMDTPGEISLQTTPSTADTFTANVVLTVQDPTTKEGFPEFPAWVLVKYGRGILNGLLGRMMTQPAKPYTNEKLGTLHARQFTSFSARAATEVLHGNLSNGQTWRFPQSFATRRR